MRKGCVMISELRILMVEDNVTDAGLVCYELEKLRRPFETRRVESRDSFLREMKAFNPDLILSDFTLPHFDGMSALEIAQTICPDIPFIFVSGTIGEDLAVKALKKGASDYILKDHLLRLAPAVERILTEIEESQKKTVMKAALREKREILQAIFHHAPIAICRTDASGIIVSWNIMAENISGWKAEELAGEPISKFMGEKADEIEDLLKITLRGATVEGAEIRGSRRTGELVDLYLSASPLRDAEGQIFGTVFTFIDVTEKKRALDELRIHRENLEELVEEKTGELKQAHRKLQKTVARLSAEVEERKLLQVHLEKKNAELADFAHKVSHELKSNLLTVKRLLECVTYDPDFVKKNSAFIADATSKLIDFVEKTLQHARAERPAITIEELPLASLASEAFESIRKQDVAGSLVLGEHMPKAKGDVQAMKQIFRNLMANSFQHRSNGNSNNVVVEVSCKKSADHVQITYRDNGPGIAPENSEKIFDVTFTTKKSEIFGFGLSTVKKLIEAQGGKIHLSTRRKEPGVEFIMTLPR